MKRILVPSLLALACGAALAQSSPNITVYGLVDVGINRVSGLKAGSDMALVSGIMEGSRFGISGEENIGGGYRALFRMEHRIEANNGTISTRPVSGSQVPDRLGSAVMLGLPAALQPAVSSVAGLLGSQIGVNLATASKPFGAFWDRQIYVGLVTPVGAVLAGHMYTPAYETTATFDALGTQSSLSAGQVSAIPAAITIRADNALSYRIVTGPISASLMYAFGDVAGNSKANRLMGVQGVYKTDLFSVGAGYNERNNEVGQKSLKSAVFGAKVKLGPGTVSGLYAQFEDDNPAGLSAITPALTPVVGAATAGAVQAAFAEGLKQDSRQYQLGYKVETGPHTFYLAFNRLDDQRPNNADTDSYGVVYTYALSKRTDVNAVLVHFSNKGLAQAAPGQAGFLGGVTATAGTGSNNVALGIRHRF